MIEKGRISSRQGALLLVTNIVGTIFLFLPRLLLDLTTSDGLVALVTSAVISWLFFIFVYKLVSKFPEETIFQFSKTILGKYLGSFLGLFVVAGALTYAATVVRSMGEFFITLIMPQTPLSVFIMAMLVLAVITAAYGIEAIGRLNEFWLPIILFSFFLIYVGVFPQWEFFRLQPLFMTKDLPEIAIASFSLTNVFLQSVIIIFFFPFVSDHKGFFKKSSIAIATASLVLIGIYIVTIGMLGKDLTRAYVWPALEVARNIQVAGFFEQMEAIFVVIWLLLAYLKISVFVYAASLGVAQTFNIKKFSWLPFLLAIPIYYIAFQPQNLPEVLHYVRLWEIGGLVDVFAILIPIFLLVVAAIRGKGGKKSNA